MGNSEKRNTKGPNKNKTTEKEKIWMTPTWLRKEFSDKLRFKRDKYKKWKHGYLTKT